MQADQVIAAYRQLRKQKEDTAARHKEELAPINESMGKLEAWLQAQLLRQGIDSIAGPSGTAFLQDEVSVTVEDFNLFVDWVFLNGAREFLEKRAAKTVVKDFVDSFKDRATGNPSAIELPPGLKYTSEKVVRVRKS